jgi:cobalamin-dependent methionine synthase I
VIDALVNAATTKIEAAKDAGKITAKRAAAIEQKLPELVSKLVNHAGLRAPGKAKAQDKRHQRVRHAVELAAQTIGIDAKDLASELRAGKSIAEVATAHNVDPQTVIDALVNAATTKIEAAKNAGKITAERAAAIEQKLPELVSKLVNHHFGARLNAGAGV